jgi:hypothetical protein
MRVTTEPEPASGPGTTDSLPRADDPEPAAMDAPESSPESAAGAREPSTEQVPDAPDAPDAPDDWPRRISARSKLTGSDSWA